MENERILKWYSQKKVQKELLEIAKDREVVSVFKDGSFGKRPDVLLYENDILAAVENKVVAFHASVERWENPMQLKAGINKSELDELRKGWEIFIDPDVKDFEIAKIVTLQIIEALKDHGIKNISLKFSGGNSFHLAIPFESLPSKINFEETRKLYPELLEKILLYLKSYVEENLREELLSNFSANEIAKRIGKNVDEILTQNKLDPFKVVNIDIFGSRHLFRMPFSLNEKTLLVSLPLTQNQLKKFKKEDALIEKAKIETSFLKKYKENEAIGLVTEALDWFTRKGLEKIEFIALKEVKKKKIKIEEKYFPPCIKRILEGMEDGRKRSIFVLVTFLRNMGWSDQEVEKKLYEWNEKNKPKLRDNYIRTQLRWHFKQERNLLPPNCDHPNFYKDMGLDVYCNLCLQEVGVIKNPVNYAYKLFKQERKIKKLRVKK
jgi:uncharacterized protein (DUF3820 family)